MVAATSSFLGCGTYWHLPHNGTRVAGRLGKCAVAIAYDLLLAASEGRAIEVNANLGNLLEY